MPKGPLALISSRPLLPIIILSSCLGLAWILLQNPPEAGPPRPPKIMPLSVRVMPVQAQPYQIVLSSYGVIEARHQAKLQAQVSGVITYVSEAARRGGQFKAGDVLFRIDPRDYQLALDVARAQLRDAERAVVQEEAQAEQALKDWNNLGRRDKPSALILREPQLMAARAALDAARAKLAQAELALERTIIRAPYAGFSEDLSADIGQLVNSSSVLSSIFSSERYEIRLPIRDQDRPFLPPLESNTDIALYAKHSPKHAIAAKVVRQEAAIDADSRQLHIIAELSLEALGSGNFLREYLTANIPARHISDAIVIPAKAIYQGRYVYTVREGIIYRRDIEILWQNTQDAIISTGLQIGDQLVTTSLGAVASGTRVSIIGGDK